MAERKNYAKFRRELKGLCPWLGEQEIYKNWIGHLRSEFLVKDCTEVWQVRQDPTLGTDGKYHYVYITTNSNGEIYVGKHSCNFMHDGYQGSGDEIREAQARGDKLTTTPLEFFRTDSMALAAEGEIVDRMFLIEPGVLNKIPGGDDSRHNEPEPESAPTNPMPEVVESTVETPFGDIENVPVMKPHNCPKVVESPRRTTLLLAKNDSTPKSSPNFCSFDELGPKVGDKLEYVPDPTIFAEVLDSDRRVKCQGKSSTLTTATLKLLGIKYEKGFQPLNYWRWNGKLLIEIREELLKKGK